MNAFTRGLDPKVAMTIGAERCPECHKVLLKEREKELHLCKKCAKKIDAWPTLWRTFSTFRTRLTFLGKLLFIGLPAILIFIFSPLSALFFLSIFTTLWIIKILIDN